MRILILGATGRTGKLVLKEALEKGYQVNCLVRDVQKVIPQHENLQVFEGSPLDVDTLTLALKGCQVILNTLNVSRTSDFPWAKLRTPKTLLSDVIRSIISLSSRDDIKRIIVCSAWGVSETKKDLPGWFRWFIDNSNISAAYQDHERQEALLMSSDLPWTIARPSGLTNSKRHQNVIESYANEPRPKLLISRGSVAKYMVAAIENESLIGKAPTLSAH